MFKLTIECSENIKRLVLDFEDSETLLQQTKDNANSSEYDFVNRIGSVKNTNPKTEKTHQKSINEKTANVRAIDTDNRPPMVDEGFNESL